MSQARASLSRKHGNMYRCDVAPCVYRGYLYRIRTHYLNTHLTEDEVPFLCKPCGTRWATKEVAIKHLESTHAGHKFQELFGGTHEDLLNYRVPKVPMPYETAAKMKFKKNRSPSVNKKLYALYHPTKTTTAATRTPTATITSEPSPTANYTGPVVVVHPEEGDQGMSDLVTPAVAGSASLPLFSEEPLPDPEEKYGQMSALGPALSPKVVIRRLKRPRPGPLRRTVTVGPKRLKVTTVVSSPEVQLVFPGDDGPLDLSIPPPTPAAEEVNLVEGPVEEELAPINPRQEEEPSEAPPAVHTLLPLPPMPVPVFSEETQAILRDLTRVLDSGMGPLAENLGNIAKYLQRISHLLEDRLPKLPSEDKAHSSGSGGRGRKH